MKRRRRLRCGYRLLPLLRCSLWLRVCMRLGHNGVADVMVTNRMTVFPSSPSVTGETTTACALARVCVCVCVCCREKQQDLEISNPLWISRRPDIKETYCSSAWGCSKTVVALYSGERRSGSNNQRGSGWRNAPRRRSYGPQITALTQR